MANEHWYGLRVRTGFAAIVAQKLRKLAFEVVVPEQQSKTTNQPPSGDYVYCRFELENSQTITSVPGVIGIVGSPKPTCFDGDVPASQRSSRSR